MPASTRAARAQQRTQRQKEQGDNVIHRNPPAHGVEPTSPERTAALALVGLQEVESRADTEQTHAPEHPKALPEGRGQRVKKPSPKKLAATKAPLPTRHTPKTTPPPASSPPPPEYYSSPLPIQIHSDTSEPNKENTRQLNPTAKRPATGSGNSPPKKAARKELDANSNQRFKYQVTLKVTLDNDNSRSSGRVFHTGGEAYQFLQETESRFEFTYIRESDTDIFFHEREAIIIGNTKAGKIDKSQAFSISDEEDYKGVEETLLYLNEQKYYGLKVEVLAKYGSTKRRLLHREDSDVVVTGSGKAIKPEKGKNSTKVSLTQKVNIKERITLADSTEIRNTWACNSLQCRNPSKNCVIDPENSIHLPLLESDINYWAKERYDNPELTIDPVPERILTRLRQKASNKTAQRQRTAPSPSPALSAASAPSMTFNFPSWMAGMGFPTPPSAPSITGSSSSAPAHTTSSPPRDDAEAGSEFCEFLANCSNSRLAARLIEVGVELDKQFIDAQMAHRFARKDKARLQKLEVEEGIIEKLADISKYDQFARRNRPGFNV